MTARRPVGAITRGTTGAGRLRRVDGWLGHALGPVLRGAADPLVVDLGYGATPITTVQLRSALAAHVRPDVRVVGLEIDPDRVESAAKAADPPGLDFRRGGFELAGLRPVIVRALNVLRQYDEGVVAAAWRTVAGGLAPGGALVEGTCDERGHLGTWLTIDATGTPTRLTLTADLTTLDRPAAFAARLPKALIHHNVPGQAVHGFLAALDHAWAAAVAYAPFGARQRFARAVAATRDAGWPIVREPRRWRLGELTVAWSAVAPA
ncbi:MAG: class I SAM-dependent methyltransferase [Micromonosporaceae bacterium]